MKGNDLVIIAFFMALTLSMYVYITDTKIVVKNDHGKVFTVSGNYDYDEVEISPDSYNVSVDRISPTPAPTPVSPTPPPYYPYYYTYYPYGQAYSQLVYYPSGHPGGYMLTMYFTVNGSIRLINAYGDLVSKEIYPDGHGGRIQVVGYVQTTKNVSVQINDLRSSHVIRVQVIAPPGYEFGLRSDGDEVTYIAPGIWTVRSDDGTYSITFEIYALPVASGEGVVNVKIDAI